MLIPEDIIEPVIQFFDGDLDKVATWINTDIPMLGYVSPCKMLLLGRDKQLKRFIDDAMRENGSA